MTFPYQVLRNLQKMDICWPFQKSYQAQRLIKSAMECTWVHIWSSKNSVEIKGIFLVNSCLFSSIFSCYRKSIKNLNFGPKSSKELRNIFWPIWSRSQLIWVWLGIEFGLRNVWQLRRCCFSTANAPRTIIMHEMRKVVEE